MKSPINAKFEIYAGNLNLTVLRTDGNFGCVRWGESSFTARRKHPLLINLKFSKNSEMIVYHCRTICKNFKIFNETGKDFVLIQ
jgi:hypothetical protein